MRKLRHLPALVGIVLAPSALLYVLHYLLFRDVRDVEFYTLMDLAFLPIQAILVSLVLETFLSRRELGARTKKLGMVSGAFFSELGDGLLSLLADLDPRREERLSALSVNQAWEGRDFQAAARDSASLGSTLELDPGSLRSLSVYISARRDFLLRLIENPLLLDHEVLTDSLMAIFHVHDELRQRPDLASLPPSDLAHLRLDLERAYAALLAARLVHLEALKSSYPFLYSLALRTNPLVKNRDAVVR